MKKKNKYYVELTPELITKAQEKIDHILNNGYKVLGISDKCITKPDWYDEKYFRECQKTMKNFNPSANIASLIGLIFILQLPLGLIPLLATGQSKNLSKLFNRYLATFQHVNWWYRFDPWDENSKAFKSQSQVRSMHKSAAKFLNSKCKLKEFFDNMLENKNSDIKNDNDDDKNTNLKDKNNNLNNTDDKAFISNNLKNLLSIDPDRLWVSQGDMVLTQWAFIGILVLKPYECGIHGANKKKIEQLLYLWRVIGYKIGIEDEYNLFTETDFDLVYAMCKIIFETNFYPYLVNVSSPLGLAMGEGIINSLKSVIPYINWRSFISYWYENLGINSHELNKLKSNNLIYNADEKVLLRNLNQNNIQEINEATFEKFNLQTIKEKINLKLIKAQFNYGFKFSFIRSFSNKMSRRRIRIARKNKQKIIERLEKNKNENSQFSCPFAFKIESEYLDIENIKS